MEAKLNIEVDRLAGEYQDEFGAYSPITHMYPTSPAVLENRQNDNNKQRTTSPNQSLRRTKKYAISSKAK